MNKKIATINRLYPKFMCIAQRQYHKKHDKEMEYAVRIALSWIIINVIAFLPWSDEKIANFVGFLNTLWAFFLFYSYKFSIRYVMLIIFTIDLLTNYHIGLMTLEYYVAFVVLQNFEAFSYKDDRYHSIFAYSIFISVAVFTKYLLFYILESESRDRLIFQEILLLLVCLLFIKVLAMIYKKYLKK